MATRRARGEGTRGRGDEGTRGRGPRRRGGPGARLGQEALASSLACLPPRAATMVVAARTGCAAVPARRRRLRWEGTMQPGRAPLAAVAVAWLALPVSRVAGLPGLQTARRQVFRCSGVQVSSWPARCLPPSQRHPDLVRWRVALHLPSEPSESCILHRRCPAPPSGANRRYQADRGRLAGSRPSQAALVLPPETAR